MLVIYLLVLIISFFLMAQTQSPTCPSGWSVDMNRCCFQQQTGATNTSCALSHTGAYAVDENSLLATQIQVLNLTVQANVNDLTGIKAGDLKFALAGFRFMFDGDNEGLNMVLCAGCAKKYCKYCP